MGQENETRCEQWCVDDYRLSDIPCTTDKGITVQMNWLSGNSKVTVVLRWRKAPWRALYQWQGGTVTTISLYAGDDIITFPGGRWPRNSMIPLQSLTKFTTSQLGKWRGRHQCDDFCDAILRKAVMVSAITAIMTVQSGSLYVSAEQECTDNPLLLDYDGVEVILTNYWGTYGRLVTKKRSEPFYNGFPSQSFTLWLISKKEVLGDTSASHCAFWKCVLFLQQRP